MNERFFIKNDLNLTSDCRRYDDPYKRCIDSEISPSISAENIVMSQFIDTDSISIMHINPDLVFALDLIEHKKGQWSRPAENDTLVIKTAYDSEGKAEKVEIKTFHLRDYLAARNLTLYIHMYAERVLISSLENKVFDSQQEEKTESYERCCYSNEYNQDGEMPGQTFAVMLIKQKIGDLEEDLPTTEKTDFDEEIMEKYEGSFQSSNNVFRNWTRFWTHKVVKPHNKSAIVKREYDHLLEKLYYRTDFTDKMISSLECRNKYEYLWFSPKLIEELLSLNRGNLKWHSKETGTLWFDRTYNLHFGLNKENLINILAHDVSMLHYYYQKIINSFNHAPSGGVSKELLECQKGGKPSESEAPEDLLLKAIYMFDENIKNMTTLKVFNMNEDEEKIRKKIHRFRAVNEEGLYTLAKDIDLLFMESLDKSQLKILCNNFGTQIEQNWGSRKLLEAILNSMDKDGRKLCEVLAMNYDLRLSDAHIPSQQKISNALSILGISEDHTPVEKAERLIFLYANAIGQISNNFYAFYCPEEFKNATKSRT